MSSASSAAKAAMRRAASMPAVSARRRAKPEVQLEMPRLGLVQTLEHLSRRAVQHAAQGSEALARARLDEGPADHEVDLALEARRARPAAADARA